MVVDYFCCGNSLCYSCRVVPMAAGTRGAALALCTFTHQGFAQNVPLFIFKTISQIHVTNAQVLRHRVKKSGVFLGFSGSKALKMQEIGAFVSTAAPTETRAALIPLRARLCPFRSPEPDPLRERWWFQATGSRSVWRTASLSPGLVLFDRSQQV